MSYYHFSDNNTNFSHMISDSIGKNLYNKLIIIKINMKINSLIPKVRLILMVKNFNFTKLVLNLLILKVLPSVERKR
jgi:hypothetical protein